MTTPFGTAAARHWKLDPQVIFLNHGSFGACPRPVLEEQNRWRAELEREPVTFMSRNLERYLDVAREALGRFVHAPPEDLGFVPNASAGVATVLRSLALEPGDELLTTNHLYNACRVALHRVAEDSGATVREIPVPFPLQSPSEVEAAVLSAVTSKTRLVLLDHITSPTALVFPVASLVQELAARGVDTLVDGAHGPGMLELHVEKLGAAYYTGNCHKWMCTPKGSAFLYVRRDRQAGVHPLILSHGGNSTRKDRSRFRLEFDFTGTMDPSPWLCIPEAVRFFDQEFQGGWEGARAYCRALVLRAREVLCAAVGTTPPAPESMLGNMATVLLPLPPLGTEAHDPLHEALFEKHHIEAPVWSFGGQRMLRVTAQVYNHAAQYEALANILKAELQ
jgi:isopenicillin-N epimerase